MKHPNCEHCERLWADYSKATGEYYRLEGKHRLAELGHDAAATAQLLTLTEAADAERARLRSQFREHQAAHDRQATAARA